MPRPRRTLRRHGPDRRSPRAQLHQVPRPLLTTDGPLAREARRLLADAALARRTGFLVLAIAVLPYPRLLTVPRGEPC